MSHAIPKMIVEAVAVSLFLGGLIAYAVILARAYLGGNHVGHLLHGSRHLAANRSSFEVNRQT
jgi:hypothetical protein